MLLEFSVANYLSFKERKTLSLESSSITEFPENIIYSGDFKLLRSAVIYGANSSGKSNLIKAFVKMRSIVRDSAKNSSTDKIDVIPFQLSVETENAPSFFEILFLIDGVRYRYGFEVDDEIVHSEWLFSCSSKKEKELFTRVKDTFDISKEFSEGIGLGDRTRENALFLSITDQFNGALSKKIMEWFNGQYVVSGIEHERNNYMTLAFMKNERFKSELINFIQQFDLGFNKIELNEETNTVRTFHDKFDINGKVIGSTEFSLIDNESSGTNKLFDMTGHIWLGLFIGRLVVIDELDAKLHPLITQTIVKLFNNPLSNPNNGQLIFATHDTNLLNFGGFRRDQIYFTEKDQYQATDLYSLVEYKDSDNIKPRKDSSFEKDYINGRYGAIPFVGNFQNLGVNEKTNQD